MPIDQIDVVQKQRGAGMFVGSDESELSLL
jgi:ATP-dependent Zn protease